MHIEVCLGVQRGIPLTEKLQNESFPNLLRIFSEFFWSFRGSGHGNGDQKKFTENPHHFSMQDSQANSKNKFTKFSGEQAGFSICTGHRRSRADNLDQNLRTQISVLHRSLIGSSWKEPSMDQYQCRGKLLKNFQDHWSIRISPGKRMDQ